jgi:leader peptidase (prepilin peptidase)/N-methyltransferase
MAFMFLLLGLILGSFLAALTWRLPREISISKGRSFCPQCRKKIEWYDNIPVISFFLLGRRCRNCKTPISSRYPLIEVSTAILFFIVAVFYQNISSNITWLPNLNPILGISYVLFLAFIFLGIFTVDVEQMLIPDELLFGGMAATLGVLFLTGLPLYVNLLTGFVFGLIFLGLNFLTRGKGMGLGDAKFVILIGFILGPLNGLIALLLSFVVGAIFGLSLLITRMAKLQQKIAFGPFLVIGFLGSIFFANEILKFIYH